MGGGYKLGRTDKNCELKRINKCENYTPKSIAGRGREGHQTTPEAIHWQKLYFYRQIFSCVPK